MELSQNELPQGFVIGVDDAILTKQREGYPDTPQRRAEVRAYAEALRTRFSAASPPGIGFAVGDLDLDPALHVLVLGTDGNVFVACDDARLEGPCPPAAELVLAPAMGLGAASGGPTTR